MAGRIPDADIAAIRERVSITEVVGEYVALRRAGGDSSKGLCPFHEERTPSFIVSSSRGTYHCLAGETGVLTWDGVRPIRELAGGTHRILTRGGRWVDAPFRSFGVQPLLKLTLSRNRQTKVLYATGGHRWFVTSGKSRQGQREVVTEDLRLGHRLVTVSTDSRVKRTTPSPFGIAHGITFGDGTRLGRGSMAQLDPVKDTQLLKWFPNSMVTEDGSHLLVHHLPGFFKDLPSLDESTPYLYGWLAGYLAADGHVATDGTIMLNCADRSVLEHVRAVCTRLGIGTYGITEQMRVGFPGREPSAICRVHLVNDDVTEALFLHDDHRFRFVSSSKAFARRGWVVQSVETTDRVEEVFCAEVAGTHAFVLEDNVLTGNCFGCGVGGDVIDFVRRIEQLGFVESVERLAARAGVQIRYEGGGAAPTQRRGERTRMFEANAAAAKFYTEQLASAEAATARAFLIERGFDAEVAATFGCGYAPAGWDVLTKHLRGAGFSAKELLTAGLAKESSNGGVIDRFRRRLLWPIKAVTSDVVGFGARKLFDDDNGPKYLNTPETPLYKKSEVLYGVDLAKREISRRRQAVIVEGYTDVMAAHVAGVPTAVATCGTAFGAEHVGVLRRLLMDSDDCEVIFTFDGDEAGQQAALRAFGEDQRFVAQTFVAVEPSGLDPCDLRQTKGDVAVRDLVARREPMTAFALRSVLRRYDLDTVEGRVQALRQAAPLVARIKDRSMRPEYARKLAGDLGMEVSAVVDEVRRSHATQQPVQARAQPTLDMARPRPDDPRLRVEREALKLAIQSPALAGPLFDDIDVDAFTDPAYGAVRSAIATAGGTGTSGGGPSWVESIRTAGNELTSSIVSELAVEPLHAHGDVDGRYVGEVLAKLQEYAVDRRIKQIKSKLQRINPVEDAEGHTRLFGELVALEQYRRGLRDQFA